jgi:hypothetical protein
MFLPSELNNDFVQSKKQLTAGVAENCACWLRIQGQVDTYLSFNDVQLFNACDTKS